MSKSKGAPKRARRVPHVPREVVELGAGAADNAIAQLLQTLIPVVGQAIGQRIAAGPKAQPADLEGRVLRMETQVGYLSTELRAARDRITVLEGERKH